jgi:hypothetical protein
MLYTKRPFPVKFICGFIFSKEDIYVQTKKNMEKKFGRIDFESNVLKFDFTDYYQKEMGSPLFRKFISFERLIDPQEIIKIKLFCIKLEKKFSVEEKRKINIDPGYLNEAKLVLATTKDYFHRIYLGRGIFAEVTLYYRKNNFYEFTTTYPDYRTSQYKSIFVTIREIYHQQLKKLQNEKNK